QHLASPRRRQDRKFESARSEPVLLPKRDHELAKVAVRQRRMMLDLTNVSFLLQHFVEVIAPPRRIVASAVSMHRRVPEHRLDPLAHAARRLRLGVPDWF